MHFTAVKKLTKRSGFVIYSDSCLFKDSVLQRLKQMHSSKLVM